MNCDKKITIVAAYDTEQTNALDMDSSLQNHELSLQNGLDPIGIELISSKLDIQPKLDDSTEFADSLIEEKVQSHESSDLKIAEVVINTLINDESTASVRGMTREMKNLQKSTQNSKVLSNFLNDDSPRIRRKPKEPNSLLNESETAESNTTIDNEIPLKDANQENDSDSTIIVRDEEGKKRRKSFSRSRTAHRSKSVAVRPRPKSISRMLSDELAVSSDKDGNREDDEMEDLTNVSLAMTKPVENRAPNPPPKPGWDSYCFKCHLDNAVLSLACKTCKCSFHRHCARMLYSPIPKNPDDFICADCIEIEKIQQSPVNKYNHSKIDLHTLKDMLITVLEKIRSYPDRDCYDNDIQFKSTKESNQPLIITQISLKTIEERIMNNYYKVSETFLHDVKQLEHNWTIIDRNKTKSLKNIWKFVMTEINEMEACVHCYSSSFVISNWFTIPCKRPHLLIWAKLKGYPYWPAKVMSIDNQKLYADVRFFGAHDRAWVPVSHCLLFSEKDPNKVGKATPTTPTITKSTSKSQKGIFDAMKEKDEYIENVREKYGFRFATVRETLDPNLFQKQLESQLPNLKKDASVTEKNENDNNQKEKLTLKIVTQRDGTQTIEQRTPKIGTDKDRQILYTVLSKNEDGSESSDQSRVKAIILKRNTQSDSEKGKGKKSQHPDDSETSESNISLPEGIITANRRKSVRDVSKQKKLARNIDSRSVTPEPSKKKTKLVETNDETALLVELPEKPQRKSRKSILQDKEVPIIVAENIKKIPTGTHEIHSLRESPPPVSVNFPRHNNILNRSKSVDKELIKSDKLLRRSSVSSTARSPRENSAFKQNKMTRKLSSRRSVSQNRSGRSTPFRKRSNSQSLHTTHPHFSKNLVIKQEPMTDEEIVQRQQLTINDYADLVGEGSSSNKRKTILISTSDNSNDSFTQNHRARKTFPNSLPIHRLSDAPQIRNSNAMVCIPQVFPCEVAQHEEQSTQKNGTRESSHERMTITPSSSVQSNNSVSNLIDLNPSSNKNSSQDLPPLVPKPSGVFSNEGNAFQRDSGVVSELFSENAHRMTDYFKSLLIDTIGAVASGVSEAQNVLLKLEIEKLKMQLNNVKAENQTNIEKMMKERDDEIKFFKLSYDEKIKNIQQCHDHDKKKLINEIRQQCETEKQRAIEATKHEVKRVTWCSNCPKEARFYCCWNTSYCGPACQKNHWQNHLKFCTNRNSSSDGNTQNISSNNRKKSVSEIIPISIASPNQTYVPVTVSVPTIPKQVLRIGVPRQTSPQVISQQMTLTPTIISSMPPNTIQPDSTQAMRSPQKQHSIVHGGHKAILQPLLHTIYQQHKISSGVPAATIKAISSTLATEQSLIRTIPQNNNPISTPNKTTHHMNELVSPITSIANNSIAMNQSQNYLIATNGSKSSLHISATSSQT